MYKGMYSEMIQNAPSSFPTNHLSDSDVYPMSMRPTPTASFIGNELIRTYPDPSLCVTPDKSGKSYGKSNGISSAFTDVIQKVPLKYTSMLEDDSEETGEPRSVSKVRFDHMVNVKHLSPETSKDDTKLNSTTKSQEKTNCDSEKQVLSSKQQQKSPPRTNHIKHSPPRHSNVLNLTECKQYTYPLSNFSKELGVSDGLSKNQHFDVDKTVLASTHVTDLEEEESPGPILIQREPDTHSKLDQHIWASTADSTPDVEIETVLTDGFRNPLHSIGTSKSKSSHFIKLSEAGECVLTRPEFNSTLWMNADLQKLKDSQLDVANAIHEKLKISTTKAKVADKVYTRLNAQSPQFPSSPLIGIDVTEEELVKNLKQKSSKIKPAPRRKFSKPEERLEREPDLMEYFTPELQKESPCLTLHSAPNIKEDLTTADMERTFDLYKHIRSWEGL